MWPVRRAKRPAALALAGLVLLVLLGGCAQTPQPAPLPAADDGVYRMGVTVLDLTNPYYYEVMRGISDQAAGKGVQLIVKDPQSDAHRQVEALEEFIEDGVDAILIASLSPALTEPVLARAREAGIMVVAWATELENCDSHIAIDEWGMGYQLGVEAGRWLDELPVAQRKLAVLDYPRIPQIRNRVKGMEDGLREATSGYEIVAQLSASYPEEGYRAFMEMAKDNPDIHMVLAINDGGALGALQAVEELALPADSFFIGGCDATPEAVAAVNGDSPYRCTIDLYPYYTGTVVLDLACQLLDGENVPVRFTIPTRVITGG